MYAPHIYATFEFGRCCTTCKREVHKRWPKRAYINGRFVRDLVLTRFGLVSCVKYAFRMCRLVVACFRNDSMFDVGRECRVVDGFGSVYVGGFRVKFFGMVIRLRESSLWLVNIEISKNEIRDWWLSLKMLVEVFQIGKNSILKIFLVLINETIWPKWNRFKLKLRSLKRDRLMF